MEKVRLAFSVATDQLLSDGATSKIHTTKIKNPPVLGPTALEAGFDTLLDVIGLINSQISSMNTLCTKGLQEIIGTVFKVDRDYTELAEEKIERIHLDIQFTNVEISNPKNVIRDDGYEGPITPIQAINNNKTYSAAVYIDAKIKATAYYKDNTTSTRSADIIKKKLCQIPVMVGTVICNTYGKSSEEKIRMHEDPSDPGGYFIIKGIEWVISTVENLIFNQIRVYVNDDDKEAVRLEVINKPGDTLQNSAQLIITLTKTGKLYITIKRDKLDKKQIPFYLLPRVLGITRDEDIFNNIIFKQTGEIKESINTILLKAYEASYDDFPDAVNQRDRIEAIKYIATCINKDVFPYIDMTKEDGVRQAVNFVNNTLNKYFEPHISTEGEHEDKAFYLCMLIHYMIGSYIGIYTGTDRDSCRCKRMHAPGITLAKSIKQFFNTSIIQGIYTAFKKTFKDAPFERINLENTFNRVSGTDFEQQMAKSITSGNKANIRVRNGRNVMNRLVSQQHGHKNPLDAVARMRQLTAPNTSNESAKTSERATSMRKVHATYPGYICLIHTPEGEKVGITKQSAIYMKITESGNSDILKEFIVNSPTEHKIDFINKRELDTRTIVESDYSLVYVNGDFIGCTKDSHKFANDFRQLRRKGLINSETTIYWDDLTDEVHFWVDAGRMIRPLYIVYNNRDNPDMFDTKYNNNYKNYRQMILYNQSHANAIAAGKLNFNDLIEGGIIEMVSAEESENYILAATYDILREYWDKETHPFTHLDIPQSQLGITALTAPFGNMNQTSRLTFQCNQSKSTCGYFAMNWCYRADKDTFLQYLCETPLVKTKTAKYMPPNGYNSIVAIMVYSGYNQDDSIVASKAAFERGAYNGSKFTYEMAIKEDSKQQFRIPDVTITADTKAASYSKLNENGYVPKGTIVVKNDVIIGMISPMPDNLSSEYKFQDVSLRWPHEEQAIVHNVITGTNEDGKTFIKIAFRKFRSPSIGDKFSSRAGQKGVLGMILPASYMPCTEDGIIPTLIINPHAIPSRMTIGQLVESLIGTYCAVKGTYTDGTSYNPSNLDSIIASLKEIGYTGMGYRRMISGFTGKYIKTLIFIGPVYYQRLQKFVSDTVYAVGRGRTDILTRQPIPGKAKHGALKLGEMEFWVLEAHGSSSFLAEKIFDHSDGFPTYVCKTCGNYAIVNLHMKKFECKQCGNMGSIYEVPSAWTSKMLFQQLEAMNIGTCFNLEGYKFEVIDEDRLLFQK